MLSSERTSKKRVFPYLTYLIHLYRIISEKTWIFEMETSSQIQSSFSTFFLPIIEKKFQAQEYIWN